MTKTVKEVIRSVNNATNLVMKSLARIPNANTMQKQTISQKTAIFAKVRTIQRIKRLLTVTRENRKTPRSSSCCLATVGLIPTNKTPMDHCKNCGGYSATPHKSPS